MQRRNDGPTTIIIFNVVLGGGVEWSVGFAQKVVPQTIVCMPSHCDVHCTATHIHAMLRIVQLPAAGRECDRLFCTLSLPLVWSSMSTVLPSV